MPTKYPDRGEEELHTKIFRKFKGVVNNTARNAVPEENWFYLENVQPIGDANIQTIPNTQLLVSYGTHHVYWAQYANINGTDYMIAFASDGYVFAYNIGTQTNTTIATTLSGSGSRCDQWQNTILLVIDTTGLYTWNGSGSLVLLQPNFTSTGSSITTNVLTIGTLVSGTIAVGQIISGAGITVGTSIVSNIAGSGNGSTWNVTTTPNAAAEAINGTSGTPTTGTDIAVAFGRVWVLSGRTITFSAANGYLQGSWQVANGAGLVTLTDPQIRNAVTRLKYLNGYLYIIAPSAINVISDVYVPAGASPPTPLFTNLNIQAIIGSDEPGSIFPFNQALVFANHYGIWELYGTNATKVSTDIDGTWRYIDFSQVLSGGQCMVNNILCYGMLIKRLNDPIFGSNTVLAMRHDEKWWFTNYGPLTFVAGTLQNDNAQTANCPTLYGIINNSLYELFDIETSSSPASILMTALWGMEDTLADKQVVRAGFEVTLSAFNQPFTMTIDTVNQSQQAISLTTSGSVLWINNALAIVSWQNNSLQIVSWFASTYQLYNSTTPGVYGKYVGATINGAAGTSYQFSAVNMDYKLGARWT